MNRQILILISFLLSSVSLFAESDLPIVEMKADRTMIYPQRMELTGEDGVPVYGCLSVNKQLGKRWNLGVDWHDMFDAFCSEAKVNRHAANIRLQYRF